MPKKNENKNLTLTAIAKSYSDEAEAWKFMESVCWPNGPVCPHCGSINHAYFLEPESGSRTTKTGKVSYRRLWKCADCRQPFSVLVGSLFEDSKIPLSKWLIAVHEISADKNGISSCELGRKLDITQKSAWFMAHRIREAMTLPALSGKLKGIVEADETYFGGEAKNMHKSKRKEKITGRGTKNKIPVFAIVERGGEVRSQVMTNVTGDNIREVLRANVESSASLMTDTSTVYPKAGKEFALHETVDHSADEYVRGEAYTNTAEGHFSQLKRSIDGTHHHVSEKHLQRYLAEFDFRYSTRKEEDGERTLKMFKRVSGKRLFYKKPVSKKE